MKNKLVTIILGIALLLSVGGNIYLAKTMTDTKGEVNALSSQLVTADNQIADLQEQLTDLSALQARVADLQGQLANQEVVSYTGIEINEEELMQLVKGTITSANVRLQDAKLDEPSRVLAMLPAIEDARKRNALDETFAPLEDSFNPLREENRDWTFMEAASSLGYLLFNEKNLERGYLYKSNFCKHFVAQGVYDFDVEKLENFEIDTPSDVSFYEGNENFDVNFEIFFEYEGIKWVSLVGNVNDSYTIFDIVQEKVLNGVIDITEEIDEPEQSQAVEDEPEVKNEPNGRPNRYQPKKGDPYAGIPGYEGEKPGYVYDPGFGYVPISDDPGGNKNPDRPVDKYDCVLDENDNCIIHEHHGY